MVPVSEESELTSGRIIHQTCIEGLKKKAKEIEDGLTDSAIAISGVIVTPINTAYNASNSAALDGFILNTRTCAHMESANPPNKST